MSKSRHNGKATTIKQIIKSARREFSEHGFDKTNVQKIAERAGVTKQLVYHYYQSKEQLFACVLDESSDEAMTAMTALELDHLPPTEAFRVMFNHMFDIYESDPEMASLATDGIRFHDQHTSPRNRFVDLGPALNTRMRSIIERGIARGEFATTLDLNFIFTTASLLVSGAYTNRYVIQALSGVDVRQEEAMKAWRQYSISLLVAALSSGVPPAAGPVNTQA